jgi:hypothetical protein
MKAFCVSGPCVYEDEPGSAVTVTFDRYVRMVNEFLFLEERRHDIDFATVSF